MIPYEDSIVSYFSFLFFYFFFFLFFFFFLPIRFFLLLNFIFYRASNATVILFYASSSHYTYNTLVWVFYKAYRIRRFPWRYLSIENSYFVASTTTRQRYKCYTVTVCVCTRPTFTSFRTLTSKTSCCQRCKNEQGILQNLHANNNNLYDSRSFSNL